MKKEAYSQSTMGAVAKGDAFHSATPKTVEIEQDFDYVTNLGSKAFQGYF